MFARFWLSCFNCFKVDFPWKCWCWWLFNECLMMNMIMFWCWLWWCLLIIMMILVDDYDDDVDEIYIYIYIYMLLVNSYMLLAMTWWCKHVLKNVNVDCWSFVWPYALLLSHMFMHSWLMVTNFISILAMTNTLYSIIGDDYDVFVASWGDDLSVDLVPHAYRSRV